MIQERFLRKKDLMELFAVSGSTIERWKGAGLPFTKIGSTVRFKEQDVSLWVQSHTVQRVGGQNDK